MVKQMKIWRTQYKDKNKGKEREEGKEEKIEMKRKKCTATRHKPVYRGDNEN